MAKETYEISLGPDTEETLSITKLGKNRYQITLSEARSELASRRLNAAYEDKSLFAQKITSDWSDPKITLINDPTTDKYPLVCKLPLALVLASLIAFAEIGWKQIHTIAKTYQEDPVQRRALLWSILKLFEETELLTEQKRKKVEDLLGQLETAPIPTSPRSSTASTDSTLTPSPPASPTDVAIATTPLSKAQQRIADGGDVLGSAATAITVGCH